MRSRVVCLVASAVLAIAVSGCSSKTTNGGPYMFQGASDVASVARMTGCVPQVGPGVDPDGSVQCNQGDVDWVGGGPDDTSTIGISDDGLSVDGASFQIQCNTRAWCQKALAALIAWVSPSGNSSPPPPAYRLKAAYDACVSQTGTLETMTWDGQALRVDSVIALAEESGIACVLDDLSASDGLQNRMFSAMSDTSAKTVFESGLKFVWQVRTPPGNPLPGGGRSYPPPHLILVVTAIGSGTGVST